MIAIAWKDISMRAILMLVVFVCSASVVVSSQPLQPTEQNMKPVLPEDKQFMFGTASSNSVTPLILSMLDRQFFEQTKAASAQEKDQRNTGTIKLNLLVREVLYETINANAILKTENPKEMQELANKILRNYLEAYFPGIVEDFDKKGSLTVDQATAVSDKIKNEILFRARNAPTVKGGMLRLNEMRAKGELAQMKRNKQTVPLETISPKPLGKPSGKGKKPE